MRSASEPNDLWVDAWDPAHPHHHGRLYRRLCLFTVKVEQFLQEVRDNIPTHPEENGSVPRYPDKLGFPHQKRINYVALLAIDLAYYLSRGAEANGCDIPWDSDPREPASIAFAWIGNLFWPLMDDWGWGVLRDAFPPYEWSEDSRRDWRITYDVPLLHIQGQSLDQILRHWSRKLTIGVATLDALNDAFGLLREACLQARSAFGLWPGELDGWGPQWPEWVNQGQSQQASLPAPAMSASDAPLSAKAPRAVPPEPSHPEPNSASSFGAMMPRWVWANPQQAATPLPTLIIEVSQPEPNGSPSAAVSNPSGTEPAPKAPSLDSYNVGGKVDRPTPDMFRAYRAAEQGIRQRAIAKQMGVSQPTVSRAIQRVEAYKAAGGEVPGLAELNQARPKIITTDPRKLDQRRR
jgi:Homeodomain-like domain